jgi:hypothetical protein
MEAADPPLHHHKTPPAPAPPPQQGAKGTPSDKLRLALVHVLAAEAAPSEAEVKELTDALQVMMRGGCWGVMGRV